MFDAPGELKGYVGEEDGFDPLKLSTFFDMVRRRPGAASRLTRAVALVVTSRAGR